MLRVEYGDMECKNVIKIDKTGIWYDLILHTILAFSGELTTIVNAKQHSGKLIAVMAIMTAGKKLLIFFIIKGKQSECLAKK
jgi:hypothetical protein